MARPLPLFNMRKFLLLCFVASSLVAALVPVPARAIFPALALPQVGMGFASATSFGSFVNYAAVAVGTVLMYAGVTRNAQENSGAVEVKIQIVPDAPQDTPSGWTASTGAASSGGKPTPPSSGGAATNRYVAMGCVGQTWTGTYSSAAEAGQAFVAAQPSGAVYYGVGSTSGNAGCGGPGEYVDYRLAGDSPTAHRFMPLNITLGCNAGYTVSGSNCVLSNAALVVKPSDGVCTIQRTGNSYAYDSLDPDCASPTSQVSISGSGNGTFTVIATDGSKVVSQIDQTTGKTTVTQSVPNFTSNTTTNNTVVFSAPQTGPSPSTGLGQAVVEGKSSSTVAGTGSLAGTTPSANEGQCGAPGQPKCDVRIDETGTPDPSASISSKQTEFDQKANERKAAIEAAAGAGQVSSFGLSLSIAWPNDACVNPQFVIPNTGGRVLAPDLCGPSGDIRVTMQWFLGIATALYIFMLGATALKGS